MTKYPQFKEIIVWIIIFVIGSLIVSFLIYPETFNIFKERVTSTGQLIIDTQKQEDSNTERITSNDEGYVFQELNFNSETKKTPPNLERINGFYPYDSCSLLELKAETERVEKNRFKETMCSIYCGQKDMEYYSFECIKDKLYCDCLK